MPNLASIAAFFGIKSFKVRRGQQQSPAGQPIAQGARLHPANLEQQAQARSAIQGANMSQRRRKFHTNELGHEQVRCLYVSYHPNLPDDEFHQQVVGLESMCNHQLMETCLCKLDRQVQARESTFQRSPTSEHDVLALAVYDNSADNTHALHDPRNLHQAVIKMTRPEWNPEAGKYALLAEPWEVYELPDDEEEYPDGPTATAAAPSNLVALGRPIAIVLFAAKTDDLPLLLGEDDFTMRSMRTCEDLVLCIFKSGRFEAYPGASTMGRAATLEMAKLRLDQVLEMRREDAARRPAEYAVNASAKIWGFDMETDCVFKCAVGAI